MKNAKKKKQKESALSEFDAAARARGLTYAQAQIEETCRLYQKRFIVPSFYRQIGKRGS